jgi:hypothetical protein
MTSVPPRTNTKLVLVWTLSGILSLAACSGAEARSGADSGQEQDTGSSSAALQQPGSTAAVASSGGTIETVQPQSVDPRKHALIVAIAKYREASRYNNLHSDNDVPLVRGALQAQGFDEGNITVLADRDATREGILGALSDLERRVNPGDIVVFHYSGHGHRITDDNGDELDGYDEIIVPYGAPAIIDEEGRDPTSYDGSAHIRDEELGEWVHALRAKVGPSGNVVAFIDACYSGTGTRAPYELPTRGVPEPIGPPAETARGSRDEGSGVDELAGGGTRSGEADPSLAPFVVISATQANELDHEQRAPDGKIVGPLSLALSRTLPGAGPITYRALFDRIKRDMADVPAQTPLIEGDADTQLFNGQAVAQAPYYEVREVVGEGAQSNTVKLAGGRVAGLLSGTRIALYEAGTTDPARAVLRAEGTVTESSQTVADLLLDQPLDASEISSSWAFVTQYGLGDRELNVFLDDRLGSAASESIRDTLGKIAGIELTQENAELAVVDSAGRFILVKRAAQNSVFLDPLPADRADIAALVADRVLAYGRLRDLQEIELRDARFEAKLEIVPARHDAECENAPVLLDAEEFQKAGQFTLAEGDGFVLRVHNQGTRDAYAAVLEFLADGEIEQVFPYEGDPPERIPAGREVLLDLVCFWAAPPFGNEMMKLFLTDEPVNFRPVLESQGRSRGGVDTPLQRLLAESYSRLRSDSKSRIATGSTDEVMLRIVPRQGGGSN